MSISGNFSWRLPSEDEALPLLIVQQHRDRTVKMSLEPVGEVVVLSGEEAEKDRRPPRRYVWTAAPAASEASSK